MSALGDFMNIATQILDEKDRERLAPEPHRPPIFVRTNYLFVEIDEALEKAAKLSAQIKFARLESNVAETTRLNNELNRVAVQIAWLTIWAEEQFKKELAHAG